MRFFSLITFSTVAASVSALTIPHIPHHLGHHIEQGIEHAASFLEGRDLPDMTLDRRSKFFHGGSSSEGSSSNPSQSQGNRTPSPHNSNQGSTGSSLGIGRIPSPEQHHPNQQHAKITFGDEARKHLDDLGLHGKERKQVKKEHVNRIKQEMKTNGATHATVERLAHSAGSKDPNVHITATFQKAQVASNGGIHKEPIHSSWKDSASGETKTGVNHHVYTNMQDKTKGEEAMPIHHPTYHQALKNKSSDGVAKYRRRSMY
jgi:hypothetical protein